MYQSEFDAVESPASLGGPLPPIVATDGERLMRFRRHRDEAALAEVVETHAAMVWGVCSQVLRRRQDVEDAFQATFLILARKAKSIRAAESAAGWLYRVAFRTSLLVRSQQQRRAEQPLVEEPLAAEDQLAALAKHEQCLTLLEELHALPLRYRQPLVLCYFEGKSRREAADELGVTAASVKGLLARGTRMLRTRMVRRGAALSTAMAAASAAMVSAPALAAPQLAGATAALATSFAVKSMLNAVGGAAKGAAAVTLAEKGILAMTLASAAKPAAVVLAVCLTTGLFAATAAEPGRGRQSRSAAGNQVLLVEAAAKDANGKDDKATEQDVEVKPAPAAVATVVQVPEGGALIDSATVNQTPPAPRPRQIANPNFRGTLRTSADALSTGVGLDVPIDPTPLAQIVAANQGPAEGRLTISPSDAIPSSAARPLEPSQPTAFMPPPGAEWTNYPFADPRMAVRQPAPPTADESEAPIQAVELEMEYWELKAQGLEKKSQMLATKAKMLKASGQASGTEILEMEAEATLMAAETLLCQSNAIRLKEQISGIERRQAAQTPAAPVMVLPGYAAREAANPLNYGTPAQPVPAALPWNPQPAAAIPAQSTPAPAVPQWNNQGKVEAPTPTPAPATIPPPTSAVPATTGWATVQTPLSPPVPVTNAVSDSPEEMKRKFDATRAANSQLTDAQHLYSFVKDRLAELQPAQAWHDPRAYRPPSVDADGQLTVQPPRQPMLEATARFPVPPMAEAQEPAADPNAARYRAAPIEVGAELSSDELTRAFNREIDRLERENAALKKRLKASEKADTVEKQE